MLEKKHPVLDLNDSANQHGYLMAHAANHHFTKHRESKRALKALPSLPQLVELQDFDRAIDRGEHFGRAVVHKEAFHDLVQHNPISKFSPTVRKKATKPEKLHA